MRRSDPANWAAVGFLTAVMLYLAVLAVSYLGHSTVAPRREHCQQVPAHVPHPRPRCYWVPRKEGGALRPASGHG